MQSRRNFLATSAAFTSAPSFTRSETDFIAGNIGKTLISGFVGTKSGDPEVEQICEYLSRGDIAGVLLLQRNITSPEQLSELISRFREATHESVPIIAIDQEGGKVARLNSSNGFLNWMSAKEMASLNMQDDQILDYYSLRAAELASVGINVNFSPVVDLNISPNNPIIGKLGRAFSTKPLEVIRHASLLVEAHRSANVKTCLKHFPGHGSSLTDSHLGITDVTNTWTKQELDPYIKMINSSIADAVMSGHLVNNKLSGGLNIPFSLSPYLSSILFDQLKFKGPIFSDDMQMGAITQHFGLGEAARLALNAGNSFLIYSNYHKKHTITTIRDVKEAVEIEAMLGNLDLTNLNSLFIRGKDFLEDLM